MTSLPRSSILKGAKAQVSSTLEPVVLHRLFENTVDVVNKVYQKNNNEVRILQSMYISESVIQETALISGDDQLTFNQLNEKANKLARAILKRVPLDATSGNIDGDILMAVCMKPSEALVVTLLAIWKVGAAYLPLDVEFPKSRIKHILDESKPVMTITDNDDIEKEFKATRYSVLHHEALNTPGHNLPDPETWKQSVCKTDLLAAVLYTSGSTGIPKGVRIPHSAILNRLKWQFQQFPYSSTEKKCAFKTALTFVDSICELWGPLLNARTILIIPKCVTKNPEKLIELLEKHEVERLVLVPTLLQSILMCASIKNSETFLKNLRLWVCSGEALSISLAQKFFECFNGRSITLCNFYGSTEVMGDVTYHVLRSKEDLKSEESVPIGTPITNCAVYVLDEFLRPVKMNEVGELYVSGSNLAMGYVRGRDPDRFLENTVEPDIGHLKLYKTGDFARIHRNTVYYEGRRDFQIKVRGHRVDLSEIESALAKVCQIDKYVVLAYNPGEIDQAVLAYVTIKDDITELKIENHLKTVLAPYMLPQVKIVDHIPLLVNGKVDRQYFLKKFKEESESINSTCSFKQSDVMLDYSDIPNDKIEKAEVLMPTVLHVLGKSLRSSISGKSNFYSLGGNSLNSIYTVTKLLDAGYAISITDFISSQTMLEIMDKMKKIEARACSLGFESSKFKTELFAEKHKQEVIDIITKSFYEKADLERLLINPATLDDYVELLQVLWPHLIEKNLSFVAIDNEGHVKGATLNFDAFDEPEVSIRPDNKLNVIFEFLEYLEGPVRKRKLPKGKNKVLHNFMMGAKLDLSPQETVEVFCYMEQEVLKLAKERRFLGIFTTNTNALTQQLGCDINNYETMVDYQVNEYVASDGSKPFGRAQDSQKAIVSFKKV